MLHRVWPDSTVVFTACVPIAAAPEVAALAGEVNTPSSSKSTTDSSISGTADEDKAAAPGQPQPAGGSCGAGRGRRIGKRRRGKQPVGALWIRRVEVAFMAVTFQRYEVPIVTRIRPDAVHVHLDIRTYIRNRVFLFLALVDESCQDSLEQMFEIPTRTGLSWKYRIQQQSGHTETPPEPTDNFGRSPPESTAERNDQDGHRHQEGQLVMAGPEPIVRSGNNLKRTGLQEPDRPAEENPGMHPALHQRQRLPAVDARDRRHRRSRQPLQRHPPALAARKAGLPAARSQASARHGSADPADPRRRERRN